VFLILAMAQSGGGVGARVLALLLVGWLLIADVHLWRERKQRPIWTASTALALALLALTAIPAPMVANAVLFIPLVFFTSQFGASHHVLLRSSLYFAAIATAHSVSAGFSPSALALLPVVLMISHTMQRASSLAARHARALARHRELGAMSSVLIAAEAIDEIQSAAMLAGAALATGMRECSVVVYDVDAKGEWKHIASTGSDNFLLRAMTISGVDISAVPEALRSFPGLEGRYIEVVPIVADELLGALVWLASEPFDLEFRASAESLAGQVAESIRRLEVQDSVQQLLAHSIDVLIVVDESGKVEYASPAVEALTGRTSGQVVGRSLSTLVHRQHVTQMVKHLHGTVTSPSVYNLRWGHQTTATWKETYTTISLMHRRGRSRSWVFNVHDVSEQTALEMELRHAQKLESVGRLAAGVAHEINTPIQFIGDNLRFVGSSFGDLTQMLEAQRHALAIHAPPEAMNELRQTTDELDVEFLESEIPIAVAQAIEGADRVAEIVRAMKMFGHPDSATKGSVDINAALGSTLVIAQSEIKTTAHVETAFGTLPAIQAFAGDLNQVFLNIVVNACHAMEPLVRQHSELGTLKIATYQEDDSVVVAISDTGTGIPVHARDHVFDPFYTTKEVGRGTGQGLALAHAVVEERHGGRIWFETVEGKGTTFFIKLPINGGTKREAQTPSVTSA
jgi:PAS domain S-box-containing protein